MKLRMMATSPTKNAKKSMIQLQVVATRQPPMSRLQEQHDNNECICMFATRILACLVLSPSTPQRGIASMMYMCMCGMRTEGGKKASLLHTHIQNRVLDAL
mmetsp:Transcript_21534/g.44356  ORF Transcript_21534/g.44356 Transcript_21534/m.44356 type:complete len:101 (-) Transcript_21534:1518-1820(-)